MTEPEEWRDIPGVPGYQASSLGRVRSLDRTVRSRGGQRTHRGRVLTQSPHQRGYLLCTPCVNGRPRTIQVHRLVMLAFVGPLLKGLWTAHNDGNPANNELRNLRYDTVSGNQKDKVAHGTALIGERANGAKLNEHSVAELRRLRAAGMLITDLAERFGVSRANASRVCRGELWPHIGGPLTRSYFRSEESAASAGADISSAAIHPFKHNRSGGRHALT